MRPTSLAWRATSAATATGTELADFDADGDLDLVGWGQYTTSLYTVNLNDGTGAFGAPQP